MTNPFVVKIQSSLVSSEDEPTILIYDHSKTIVQQLPATEEMTKKFGMRSYWWALLDGNDKVIVDKKSNELEFVRFSYPAMNGDEDE